MGFKGIHARAVYLVHSLHHLNYQIISTDKLGYQCFLMHIVDAR